MEYKKPSLNVLGPVHELTLMPNGDDGENCQFIHKCAGVGDGHSQEAGWS